MLKVRVMPTLLYKQFGLVKGVAFDSWRRVGSAMQAIKVYNLREVDELVFLDIGAAADGNPPDFALIDELADDCFMPMTVGGGVRSVEHVMQLLRVGADKVAICTAAVEDPDLVSRVADRFGSQCVVACIDVKRTASGCEVVTRCGTLATGRDPVSHAAEMERRGAGEILLQSVDRDGTMTGYDVEVIRGVAAAVNIPVIASGGAGNFAHMADALETGRASAVAAASVFHFTEQTPLEAKAYLASRGHPVRL